MSTCVECGVKSTDGFDDYFMQSTTTVVDADVTTDGVTRTTEVYVRFAPLTSKIAQRASLAPHQKLMPTS